MVHTDFAGPMETTSIGGSKYYMQKLVKKEVDKKIIVLLSDKCGEFINKIFETYLRKQDIFHQTTNSHTPEQNGRSVRLNRSLNKRVRCLHYEAGLEKRFLAEAVNTVLPLKE